MAKLRLSYKDCAPHNRQPHGRSAILRRALTTSTDNPPGPRSSRLQERRRDRSRNGKPRTPSGLRANRGRTDRQPDKRSNRHPITYFSNHDSWIQIEGASARLTENRNHQTPKTLAPNRQSRLTRLHDGRHLTRDDTSTLDLKVFRAED